MPELPEVEVTRQGIAPYLLGQTIRNCTVRRYDLRWPIPTDIAQRLQGQRISNVARRGKYLLIACGNGVLLVHLGMSGRLRVVPASTPWLTHEHFALLTAKGEVRLNDPRRFGAVLWHSGDLHSVQQHPLLAHLGIEPFDPECTVATIYPRWQRLSASIKHTLLAGKTIVGVGNIYASEALFLAGIRPTCATQSLSKARVARLIAAIQQTLAAAIAAGGSSLRDFAAVDGNAGYFQTHHWVYERADTPCRRCHSVIRHLVQGQRSTYYCPRCQR